MGENSIKELVSEENLKKLKERPGPLKGPATQ